MEPNVDFYCVTVHLDGMHGKIELWVFKCHVTVSVSIVGVHRPGYESGPDSQGGG